MLLSRKEIIDLQVTALKDIAKNGLPACYNGNIQDWLADFYPNFSWNPKGSLTEIRTVLSEHSFLLKAVSNRINFDLTAEFVQAEIEALNSIEDE